ncbi:MAG: CoA transferase [Candidatus Rokubacteria bacterium]|nr:CoA transferase [Candidatus Rokubacteria bacterium]
MAVSSSSGPPLQGLSVLDFSTNLSGPYCSMILGDLGADVIKVERPDGGDEARGMPPFVNGQSAPFMTFNRNKRSLTLNLKVPEAVDIALKLADRADALLENMKPGTLARLGLGHEVVSRRNPRIVYCSISGFGQTGPYRERGGFDLIAQGMSGLMSITGEEEGPPLRVPLPISDLCGGMFATIGILAGLAARERTGRGQRVDTSLLETPIALAVYEAAQYFATGEVPQRLGAGHRTSAPYQAFRTKDGWITVGGAAQHFWVRLCRLLGLDHLVADPRFGSNADRVKHRKELAALLQERFERETSAHWLDRLEAEGIPAGPIYTYDQVFADPQVRDREMAVEVEHPVAGRTRVLGIPIKLSETRAVIRRPAPGLGEQTSEILAELGLGPAERERLQARGAI